MGAGGEASLETSSKDVSGRYLQFPVLFRIHEGGNVFKILSPAAFRCNAGMFGGQLLKKTAAAVSKDYKYRNFIERSPRVSSPRAQPPEIDS